MRKLIAFIIAVTFIFLMTGCVLENNNYIILTDKPEDFEMRNVTLLDPYEINAFQLEVKYLKALDTNRLLKGFCERAGIELNAEKYGGWETSAIQGHTLGHYLTAVSQAYAASGDNELKIIVDHMIKILSECQDESGYLAAIPESHYEQLESGNTSGTWVPWYSLHKTLSGLINVYKFTGNSEALKIAEKLGDWVYCNTSHWTEQIQETVLNIEYGGMNDALYELYKYSDNVNHLAAAHSFDEKKLFDPLYRGEDILNGKHANTTIPKIIGALNRYTITGEEYYLKVAVNFWNIVVENHTYVTGGNSEWEHFGEPRILDAERTNCNCETCNTYNMLKLSRELFKITGDIRYVDYYENTFINAILSSQNPETGMTTYFQPMASGFFKVYSSPYDHFWCCTGSGMESFTKLADSIYFHNSDSLYVNRFTSSNVIWQEKNLTISQTANLPEVTLTVSGTAFAKIVLRVPCWTDEPIVKLNGEQISIEKDNNFIILEREWTEGDIIEYCMPMKVTVHRLPDNPVSVAFKYGPFVLSADMGKKDMFTSTTGVNVTIPLLDSTLSDILVVTEGSVESWLKNINSNLVKEDNSCSFKLIGTDQKFVFSPHYMQHSSRYGIYFRLYCKESEIPTNESDKYTVIDSVPVGNDQYEFSHFFESENSTSGNFKGLMFRDASPCGWFSYKIKIDNTTTNFIAVKYYSGDVGRAFTIFVDNIVLEHVVLDDVNPNGFYDVYYKIPEQLTDNKNKITITFKADKASYAGGIFDQLKIVKMN